MQLVLETDGLWLRKSKDCFQVSNGVDVRLIAPNQVTSISVRSTQVTITTAAILLAIEQGIPIVFFDRVGRPKGRIWSNYFGSIASIRRGQLRLADNVLGVEWMASVFRDKMEAQTENLIHLTTRRGKLAEQVQAVSLEMQQYCDQMAALPHDGRWQDRMMGIEGMMARKYWQLLAKAMPQGFDFEKRSRRPALDSFNAALNYGYGMLYATVEGAIISAGLDPMIGVLHADEYNKPVFVFDMIEPFRPWIDRLLLETCLDGKWSENYFISDEETGGVLLNTDGKKWLIPSVNAMLTEKIRFKGKQLSRQNHINRYAGTFAQWLLGQKFK
jgi:CRISP-associated protein Cas1